MYRGQMSEIVSWKVSGRGRRSSGVKRPLWWCLLVATMVPCSRGVPERSIVGGAPVAAEAKAIDDETVAGPEHYSNGYPTQDKDGAVHAVVEIPAGTVAKFEVDDGDGRLKWEHSKRDGQRRAVDYLPYPVNYGMIPRTLADDGQALDVIVLGRGIERGHVAKTRVIGVVMMAQDDGTRDDKLLAVPLDKPWRNGFSTLRDLPELEEHYPAVRDILD